MSDNVKSKLVKKLCEHNYEYNLELQQAVKDNLSKTGYRYVIYFSQYCLLG